MKPDAVVIVATVKALKLHGGANKTEPTQENIDALSKGIPNLLKHIDNIKNVYKLPVVVAINQFTTDTEKELNLITDKIVKNTIKNGRNIEDVVWAILQ